jgi:hypothetical protein
VSCFNVDPEFASALKFPKSRGGGEFEVVYMESAFDKEAGCGEFYLEFGEYIWEYKLVERFEAQGACQVNAVTFGNNDGHESASNALLRVLKTQEKTGLLFTKGVRPAGLAKKVQEKLDNARKELMSVPEWDEKTKNFVSGKLERIENNVQGQAIKLEKIENDVQSQVVKIEGVQSEVTKIGTYVSDTIPDFEKRLASETKQKFENMGRYGSAMKQNYLLVKRIEELEKTVHGLREENQRLNTENAKYAAKEQSWIHEKEEFFTVQKLIASLQRASQMSTDVLSNLQHSSAMNASILESNTVINEELQRTADALASTLKEERAAKRARAE